MPAFVHGLSEMTSTATARRHCSNYKTSLDFDEYLLASSPPGFDYGLAEKFGGCESLTADVCYQFPLNCKQPIRNITSRVKCSNQQKKYPCFSNGLALDNCSDFTMDNRNGDDSVELHGVLSSTNKQSSRGGAGKRVSFADDFGLRLTEIKYFFEMPDAPPLIRTKMVVNDAKLSPLRQNFEPSITKMEPVNPLLVPDFPMPISNHKAFSQKVEKDFVSLESLYVSTNQTLVGTVKVQNLDFHKTVFIRCTFDDWKSSTDIPCRYRPKSYLEASNHSSDWFTFTMTVPSALGGRGCAEFAVCFQCNGIEYWDNNMRSNYRLVSPDWYKKDTQDKDENVNEDTDLNWTTYVGWNNRSRPWPYW